MDKLLEDVKRFSENVLRYRSVRENQWRELSDWIAPHRGILNSEDMAPNGERRNKDAFTSTAQIALGKGASGITSGMTPRNISWFEPDFEEEELIEASGARAYLDAIDLRMKATLERGGFYQAIHAFNTDLLWAGCAMLYAESSEQTILRFECLQVGTYAVQLDVDGGVESVYRTLAMSPMKIASVFGKSAMSEDLQKKLERQPYELVRVYQLVRPREWRDPQKIDKKNMPYQSVYWTDNAEKVLHEGGYHEMPFFFAVWHEGNTPYGTGPGDVALNDSRQIDKMERSKLLGLGKLVGPPVQADSSLKGVLKLGQNEINYVDGDKTIRPILEMTQFAHAIQYLQGEIQTVSQRLEQELMASVFASVPFDQRPKDMSATEFLERKRETMQQLGPVMSAYEPHVLMPVLHRVANTLDREGLLPPPPQSLWGVPLAIKMDFISPMANALRQTGAEATRALLNEVLMLAQADPNVLDKIDLDQCVDEMAYGFGASGKVVRADDDVQKIREMKAQQQMQMMQMQQMQAEAQANNANAGAIGQLAGAAESVNNMTQGE